MSKNLQVMGTVLNRKWTALPPLDGIFSHDNKNTYPLSPRRDILSLDYMNSDFQISENGDRTSDFQKTGIRNGELRIMFLDL